MAKPFISYYYNKGREYARICAPARENGQKANDTVYLGRVIDKMRGIFRSKERGLFSFSLEKGYSNAPEDAGASLCAEKAKGALNFGHVYCAHALLERCGLMSLFRDTEEDDSPDTLIALVMHRLLDAWADWPAQAFFEQTYLRLLYPGGDLSPRNVSLYLKTIGSEATRVDFLRRYIAHKYPTKRADGILLDRPVQPMKTICPMRQREAKEGNWPKKLG
jgi:hypothetical protein